MTIDSLVEVDLVTADGHLITVNETSDPDLFWAVRGGGGNFGIATRFRYRLHPVNMVTGGMLVLPLTPQVLRDVVDASVAAPEELTQITFVMGLPPAPFVPPEAVGHAGRSSSCRSTPDRSRTGPPPWRRSGRSRRRIADMVGPMPYPAMYQLTADGERPGPGRHPVVVPAGPRRHGHRRHRRSPPGPAGRPGDDPAAASSAASGPGARRCHGLRPSRRDGDGRRSSRTPRLRTRSSRRTPSPITPSSPARRAACTRTSSGEEDASRLHAAYPGATYERLVQVKRRVDPENVFHANHNIRPD